MSDSFMEKWLSTEMQGKVFVHIYISGGSCGHWFAHRHYYTVHDGVVYIIENGSNLVESGDTLEKLNVECYCLGKYNPKKKYNAKVKEFRYSEIKKVLSL